MLFKDQNLISYWLSMLFPYFHMQIAFRSNANYNYLFYAVIDSELHISKCILCVLKKGIQLANGQSLNVWRIYSAIEEILLLITLNWLNN